MPSFSSKYLIVDGFEMKWIFNIWCCRRRWMEVLIEQEKKVYWTLRHIDSIFLSQTAMEYSNFTNFRFFSELVSLQIFFWTSTREFTPLISQISTNISKNAFFHYFPHFLEKNNFLVKFSIKNIFFIQKSSFGLISIKTPVAY